MTFFIICLLNSADSVFCHCLVSDMIWYSRQSSWCGLKQLPSYKLAEKQGRLAFAFPPFPNWPAAECPNFSCFFCNFVTTVVDTLRHNLSCLIKDRSALAELIRVLKYAKVSWTNFFNNQNVSKVPNRFNLFFKLTLLQIYKLAGRHMRYGSLRFPVEATRARVFVIGLLLSLQLGVLYR